MKGEVKQELSADMYRQTKPCADCPFLKKGGVRHGIESVFQYAYYFTHDPGATFPCHQTRRPGQNNEGWEHWSEGQTICAGGLIFSLKVKMQNLLTRLALRNGWWKPADMRDTDKVCDSWHELAEVQNGDTSPEDAR